MTTFEHLADDVLLNVISFLSFKDIGALSRSSKRFNDLCRRQLKSRLILVDSSEPGFSFTQRTYKRTAFDGNVAIDVKFEKLLVLFSTVLPNIRTLCLHEVDGIRDENVHTIAVALPNLNYLWLYRLRQLTDRGLSRLFPRCNNLHKLALHFLDINGSCFRDIPPVKWLSISSNWNLDGDSYYQLCTRLTDTLENFCFDNPYGTEIHKNLFLRISKLKAVEITVHKSADFVPCLREISAQQQIEELVLNVVAEVSGENLISIPIFENVKSISFIFDNRVSDEDLVKIIERFPNVKCLSLTINDAGYYGSMYRGLDLEKVFPEYLKTVECIKNLHKLEDLSLFFDKSGHFKTRVDRYCEQLFECHRLKRIKIGILNESEVQSINEHLSNSVTGQSDPKVEINLYTSAKEVRLVCDCLSFIRIYVEQDKEEREKSYYVTSNKR